MSTGRFQVGDETMRSSAEEGVKDHRRDAYAEAAARIDERFADAFGEKNIPGGAEFGAERAERANDPDDRAEQTYQRTDGRDVGEVGNAVMQIGGNPCAFRLRDLARLCEVGARILRHEIERFLHDPRN